MKIFDTIKLQGFINNSLNTIALGLFFHFSLGNSVPIELILIFSALIIFVVRDLFLGLIAIISSIAFSALIGHYSFTNQFLINGSTKIFIGIFLILSIVFAAILRGFTHSQTNSFKLHFHLTIFTLLIIFSYFFQILNKQTSDKALRFLVYMGEDNAAWLNGLPIGFNPNGDNFFDVPLATDVRSTTYGWLITFRDIISSFSNEKIITDNGLILQRFYIFVIFLSILIAVTGILNLLEKFELPAILGYFTSLLVAISVYLSLSSFALFGHLTPILSLLYLYAAIIFTLLYKKISNTSKNKIIYYSTIFLLIFATKNIWYPLAPIIYLIIFLLVLNILRSHSFFQRIKEARNFILVGLAIAAVLISYFAQKIDFLEFVNLRFTDFVNTIHWPGGSLNPGALHIFATFVFIYFYFSRSKLKSELFENREFRFIVLSFAVFYTFVLAVSVTTKPYTIDYGGQKLGLLFISLLLPINIAYLVVNLLTSAKDYLKSSAIFLVSFIFIIFAGSPTISGNPAWHQAAFPLAVLDRIEAEDTKIWEQALIAKINESQKNGKRVICFNRYNEAPDVTQSCSRFAQSLQGFFNEEFSTYWREVNWNNSNQTEFLQRKPSDFDDKYTILFLDELKWPSTNAEKNWIADLFPIR